MAALAGTILVFARTDFLPRRYQCLWVLLFSASGSDYLFSKGAGGTRRSKNACEEETVSYFAPAKTGREKTTGNGAAGEVRPSETSTARTSGDSVSTLGPGIIITGNIICEGSTQIFGRVTGDIVAMQIVIGDGACVEGNLTALEVAIHGTFKGTVRANNVRLKGAAAVEGEIFSKSLAVEENVQFEGMSRKLDKPIETSAIAQRPTVKTIAASAATGSAPAAAA
jgi:cytoskeletal protein CcmA (bactofilin family)